MRGKILRGAARSFFVVTLFFAFWGSWVQAVGQVRSLHGGSCWVEFQPGQRLKVASFNDRVLGNWDIPSLEREILDLVNRHGMDPSEVGSLQIECSDLGHRLWVRGSHQGKGYCLSTDLHFGSSEIFGDEAPTGELCQAYFLGEVLVYAPDSVERGALLQALTQDSLRAFVHSFLVERSVVEVKLREPHHFFEERFIEELQKSSKLWPATFVERNYRMGYPSEFMEIPLSKP